MSTASILPATARARRRPSVRRLAAWLAASASDPKAAIWLVIGFAAAHAVLWTFILISLKAAQDVHMDVAEGFAWGQKFQLGYGKHPPLAGWISGLWFKVFPVADWATYALAMTTLACGLVISWLIALRVVDRRRAFLVVVMLALYPIFNFKGFKYNPDLLQLVTLPLLVLAYLDAFEKRSARSGIWLGLAGALALMTKYWVLTMIGAIGLAALIHPDRLKFLRSPAPWVAISTLAVAMLPASDLAQAGRLPAADLCRRRLRPAEPRAERPARARLYRPQSGAACSARGARRAGAGMEAAILGEAGATNFGAVQARVVARRKHERECVAGAQYLADPGDRRDRSAARRPDLCGLHEDRLGDFAVLPDAAGAGRDPRVAAATHRAVSHRRDLARCDARGPVAAPTIATEEMKVNPNGAATYGARSQLARELTEAWHARFDSRWAVVAGTTEMGEPMTFYSPDHPAPFTPGELWSSGLTSLEEAKRLGFIGICDTTDGRLPVCEAWMKRKRQGRRATGR